MAQRSMGSLRLVTNPNPPLLPSAVLGMLMFVGAEAMLFAGLISAFMIVRASALDWPPPGQPRLPVETTALNTAALLASGLVLLLANRSFQRERRRARTALWGAIGLGGFFVAFQGAEWVRLLAQGLTLTSSQAGSFFYLIVGMHGLHALAGLAVLTRAGLKLSRGRLTASTFGAAQVFWYFVVGLWPILYWRIYL